MTKSSIYRSQQSGKVEGDVYVAYHWDRAQRQLASSWQGTTSFVQEQEDMWLKKYSQNLDIEDI